MDGKADFWGQVGQPVPSVNVADLKAVWELGERIEAQYGAGVAVASNAATEACSSGADVPAVGYRCGMLRILDMCRGDLLAAWKQGERFHDAIFAVIATIPMTWIGEELSQRLPFDLDVFAEELRKRAS